MKCKFKLPQQSEDFVQTLVHHTFKLGPPFDDQTAELVCYTHVDDDDQVWVNVSDLPPS